MSTLEKINTKTQFKLNKEFLDSLQAAIEAQDETQVKEILMPLHPADIASLYDELTLKEALFTYFLLDGEKAADTLMELDEDDRQKLLKNLPEEVIAREFIDNLDSDDAADLIGELEEERQKEVLNNIEDSKQAGDIVDLLSYEEDTAGGLMGKELISVNQEWSMPHCLKEMRRLAEDVDEIYYIYVTDDDNKLTGVLPLKRMLLSPSVSKVKHVMLTELISVTPEMDEEEVASIMDKYDLVAVPVVDSIGRLLGRITIDDIVDVIREEAEKDYQLASGITNDVETSDTVARITKARIPWLLIGLAGGVFAAQVIGLFEGELAENAKLAIFIPLIAAMAGNVGIQSSAIVVQSLASGNSLINSAASKIWKEFLVGSLNASILSVLLFLYNYFQSSGDVFFTLAVSISLFTVLVFASLFGTFIPLTLNRLKIDPAVATGPFITTINDIVGLLIYFTICNWMI